MTLTWLFRQVGREILRVAQGPALRTAGELRACGMGFPTCQMWGFKILPITGPLIVNPARSRRGPKGDLVTGPVKFPAEEV